VQRKILLSEMEIFTGGEGDALRRKNKAEADGVLPA
jgi:hypothetical protein